MGPLHKGNTVIHQRRYTFGNNCLGITSERTWIESVSAPDEECFRGVKEIQKRQIALSDFCRHICRYRKLFKLGS